MYAASEMKALIGKGRESAVINTRPFVLYYPVLMLPVVAQSIFSCDPALRSNFTRGYSVHQRPSKLKTQSQNTSRVRRINFRTARWFL